MKHIRTIAKVVVLLPLILLGAFLSPLIASAATFNLFSPATGILKGSSVTYITSAAGSSDVIALWSGTCNATTFMRADGSCQTVSTVSGANPTASVGLTAVNGSAVTFMRSDGAPPLDQSIVPTMTGVTWTWATAEPRLLLNETDQGSNKKLWDFDVQGGNLIGRTRTDADGTGKVWINVARGSTTQINNITLGNATDLPTVTMHTGIATFDSGIQINAGTLNVNDIDATALIMGGTAASLSGCTNSAKAGGVSAGKFTSGTTGVCTVTITLSVTATNGYACYSSDITTGVAGAQSASGTGSCQIKVTTTTGDIVTWAAIGF